MTKQSLFQIALLVLLAIIAAGVWQGRRTPDLLDNNAFEYSAPKVPEDPPLPNIVQMHPPVKLDAPTLSNPSEAPKDNAKLLGFDEKIWLDAFQDSSHDSITRLLSRQDLLYDTSAQQRTLTLAAQYGDEQKWKLVPTAVLQGLASDPASLKKVLGQLLDREQYQIVTHVVQQTYMKSRKIYKELLQTEFERKPWNRQRVEAYIRPMPNQRELLSELLQPAFAGAEEPWEWICENYKKQLPEGTFYSLNVPQIAGPSVDPQHAKRMNQLLELTSVVEPTFLEKNVDLLDHTSPHILKMCAMHPNSPAMSRIFLRVAPGSLAHYVANEPQIRQALKFIWNRQFGPNGNPVAEDLAVFESMAEWVRTNNLGDRSWYRFENWGSFNLDCYDWLYRQGFRPSAVSDKDFALFIAIRYDLREIWGSLISSRDDKIHAYRSKGISLMPSAEQRSDGIRPVYYLITDVLEKGSEEMLEAALLGRTPSAFHYKVNPVLIAAKSKNPKMIRRLLDYGFSLSPDDYPELARSEQRLDFKQLPSKKLWTAYTPFLKYEIQNACLNGDADRLQHLLEDLPYWISAKEFSGNEPAPIDTVDPSRPIYADPLVRILEDERDYFTNPRCTELLQFAGFRFTVSHVRTMLKFDSQGSLEVVFRDPQFRADCISTQNSGFYKEMAEKEPEFLTWIRSIGLDPSIP